MAKRYEVDMTKGSLGPMILKFALPLMAASLLQLLYNAADLVVVGRYAQNGLNAQGAVGSTAALINLLVNLFLGLSVGSSIVVSQHFGAGRWKDAEETVHTCMVVAAISGVVLGIVGIFSVRQMLIWMDNPPDMLDLSTLYMRIYFAGMPFNLVYNFGAAILRAVGDTKRPLYILVCTGLVNVVLNLLFVLKFNMSVDGVAWATVVSQALSAIWVVWLMVRSPGAAHLDWHKLRVHKDKLFAIIRYGLPAGVQSIMFSIANVMIQTTVNSFQEIVVTGNTVAGNLEGFLYAMVNSFYQACMTITAQNYGAKNASRVKKTLLWCLLFAVIVGGGGGTLLRVFGAELSGIYNDNADVIAVACQRLAVISGIAYALCGLMDVLVGSLRGIGLSLVPMVVTVAGVCGLRILWIHTIFAANPMYTTLLWSYPVSWGVTALAHGITFMIAYKKRISSWKNSLQA